MFERADTEIPKRLLTHAYIHGNEAAWPRDSAIEVIDFCSVHRIAVLGGEVWLRNSTGPYLPDVVTYQYTVTPDLRDGETWDSYFTRANAAVKKWVIEFEWHPTDQNWLRDWVAHFNLTMTTEDWKWVELET